MKTRSGMNYNMPVPPTDGEHTMAIIRKVDLTRLLEEKTEWEETLKRNKADISQLERLIDRQSREIADAVSSLEDMKTRIVKTRSELTELIEFDKKDATALAYIETRIDARTCVVPYIKTSDKVRPSNEVHITEFI